MATRATRGAGENATVGPSGAIDAEGDWLDEMAGEFAEAKE